MKLNLGSGRFPLDGFENLNEPEWRAQDGLPYPRESVEAITVSHLLMYLPILDWRGLFREAYRVLEHGGVLRVTEDHTAHPDSTRRGVQPGACTATTPGLVGQHLYVAGFHWQPVDPHGSRWRDESLIQNWHGDPPDVFHAEGVKP